MKKINLLILGGAVSTMMLTTACSNNSTEESSTESLPAEEVVVEKAASVNLAESKVAWIGTMLNVKAHTGTIGIQNASLTLKGSEVTAGEIVIDMNAITTDESDTNFDEEKGQTREALIGHLKSADFFDVENNPTAKFVISNVKEGSASGTLTIRGVSHEETVENLEIVEENGMVKVKGDLTFDRQKYDVAFDTGAKDMVLSNEINLNIELVAAI